MWTTWGFNNVGSAGFTSPAEDSFFNLRMFQPKPATAMVIKETD